jgi:hypothetical protein
MLIGIWIVMNGEPSTRDSDTPLRCASQPRETFPTLCFCVRNEPSQTIVSGELPRPLEVGVNKLDVKFGSFVIPEGDIIMDLTF